MSNCRDCGSTIPVPDGEYADPEARCVRCAAIAADEAARRRVRSGLILLGCSGLAVIVIVLMWRASFDLYLGGSRQDGQNYLFTWVFMSAVTLFALGLSRMPRLRRRLKT